MSEEEIAEEIRRRKESNPHKYFIPNGKAEEFINMVGSTKNFISLFSAANGVGKTATGSNIVAHICFGKSGNEFFDNLEIVKNYKFPMRGRIVSDPTTVTQTIVPELKKWLPQGRYKTSKEGKNYEYKWITDTGFEFDVMTYEQGVKEFESSTLGWAWFDEPPPLAIFKATVARMRLGGIIFITATPLMGSAWMYDHILAPDREKMEGQRDFIQADVEANCLEHGVRGRLKHSDIEKMIAEYDEEDKQARIYGKFHHLVGLVFKNWNRKIHLIRPFPININDYVVLEALDPHPRNPDAVLWVAVDRKGNKIVIDEIYGNFTTKELARRIQDKADNYRVIQRIADPSAFVQDLHQDDPEGQTLAGKLYNYGLEYDKATKDRRRADRRIKDALDYELKGDDILFAPELYVFDTCKRTIYEIEHLIWDDWRGKASERKNPMEKPVDKDDHMIECLGRILVQEPEFIPYRSATINRKVMAGGIKTPSSFDPFA